MGQINHFCNYNKMAYLWLTQGKYVTFFDKIETKNINIPINV